LGGGASRWIGGTPVIKSTCQKQFGSRTVSVHLPSAKRFVALSKSVCG
jgi:hypothetical protein